MKLFAFGTIIGAVIVLLLMQTCNKDAQVANRAKKDTIMVRDTLEMIRFKKDSTLTHDSVKTLLHTVNRIQDKVDQNEIDFNNKLAQSDFTNIKLRTALEAHDTTGAFTLCSDLQKEYMITRAAGFTFRYSRDSLLKLWPHIHSVDSLALIDCYAHSNKEHLSLTDLSALYDKTDRQLTIALKKRFSVGPFIGITYTNSFKPVYGIGVSYQLFKF